jgi:hypothetical protein
MEWTWVDFELGENVPNQALDEQWKDAVIDGRKHVSNHELALSHAKEFIEGIASFRILECLVDAMLKDVHPLSLLSDNIFRLIIEYALPGQGPLVPFIFSKLLNSSMPSKLDSSFLPFRVCVRKRPLFDFEVQRGSYDTVQSNDNHLSGRRREERGNNKAITTHDGRLARNGRILTINHRSYSFDRVWDECASNYDVCRDEIAPLVNWAAQGKSASVLCFGQTGTGKTFTLTGALDFICESLQGYYLEVKAYEIHGKKCHDLLNARKVVFLRSDENEHVHVRGAKTISVGAEENKGALLRSIFTEALALRSSEITERFFFL